MLIQIIKGRLKNRWIVCVFSDIKNAKLGTGRSSQGIEGCGGAPLWRRRPALGCSANEECVMLLVTVLHEREHILQFLHDRLNFQNSNKK